MSNKKKQYSIEYLRFSLSFAVVFYHFWWLAPRAGEAPSLAPGPDWMVYGRFAVSAFFIISGYVIAFSADGKRWQAFVASRVSRLYPALAICAVITFAAITLTDHSTSRGALNLVASWMFVPLLAGKGQIDPSYWSIVFELRFYFIVLMLLIVGALRILPAALTALAALGALSSLEPAFSAASGYILFPHVSYFALGVLLHRMLSQGIGAGLIVMTTLHIGFAAYGSYLNFEPIDMMDGIRSPFWIGLPIALACFFLVAATCSISLSDRHRKIATFVGGISYPLYLVHQVVGIAILNSLPSEFPAQASIAISIIVVLAISLSVYLFVEKPTSKRLRRVIEGLLTKGHTSSDGFASVRRGFPDSK